MHLIQETEPSHSPSNENLLSVRGLRISFVTRSGVVQAVDDVSFDIKPGETLGLVGETGCGKTQTAIAVMRLTSETGIIEKGEIWFRGVNLTRNIAKEFRLVQKRNRLVLKRDQSEIRELENEMVKIRGKHISMVFQEPMIALNPVRSVGRQIAEVLLIHDLPRLAERIISRHDVPQERIDEIATSLVGRDSSVDKIRELVRSYGIPGLEEQITSILSRRDLSYAKRLQHIKELKEEVGRSSLLFLRRVSALGKVPLTFRVLDRLPLVRRRFYGLLEKEAMNVSAELLSMVGMPNIAAVLKQYPHELSGGMRQRAMIAMAIAANPELVIADEPTSALDVTIQAQILQLLGELKRNLNTAVLFISHDLGVVAETCNKVGVIYAGNLVEIAQIEDLFSDPRHPYTKGLLSAIPPFDRKVSSLGLIPGSVPSLTNPPPGCRFNTRCPLASERCKQVPPQVQVKPGHLVRCWLYAE
jgi:peptide/nickel transport system ATP-binding protein